MVMELIVEAIMSLTWTRTKAESLKRGQQGIEMKLEVGKTYKARNGEKVEIVGMDGDKRFPFLSQSGCTFTEQGIWQYNYEKTKYDLISEWKEENMELSELEKKHAEMLSAANGVGKEIAKLKALQVAKEDVLDFTYYEPEIGGEYCFIYVGGAVHKDTWGGYIWDKQRLAQGNIYRTERCGDVIVENKATAAELKKLAGAFVPYWDDEEQEKWYIGYDFEDDEVVVDSRCYLGSGEHPYFRSRSEGKEAADKVGHERIKQLKQYGVI